VLKLNVLGLNQTENNTLNQAFFKSVCNVLVQVDIRFQPVFSFTIIQLSHCGLSVKKNFFCSYHKYTLVHQPASVCVLQAQVVLFIVIKSICVGAG